MILILKQNFNPWWPHSTMPSSTRSKNSINFICIYLTTPPHAQDTRSFLSGGLYSEFFFSSTSCHAKVKEPSLRYYLLRAWERIFGFVLISSRIWSRVPEYISYDDNYYTTATSLISCVTHRRIFKQILLKEKPEIKNLAYGIPCSGHR